MHPEEKCNVDMKDVSSVANEGIWKKAHEFEACRSALSTEELWIC